MTIDPSCPWHFQLTYIMIPQCWCISCCVAFLPFWLLLCTNCPVNILDHWQLSPCFTLSVVLAWVTPRYFWLYLYWYSQVWVSVGFDMGFCGSVGFPGVCRYSTTCAMQWRGKVIWRRADLWMSSRHISVLIGGCCMTLWLLVQPLPYVLSPFPFSVSISCTVACLWLCMW